MKQVCVGYRVLYSREFGMNKIPYKMARCPCMQEKRAGGKPLELLARRKSETSPLSLLPSSPSQGINVSFEKQTRSFPSPNCHSRTNFLPILFFFLSRIDDEHALAFGIGRYRLYIYKERLKTMNSTNRRNIGILEKWREKYSLLSVFFYSNYSLNK